VSSCEKRICWSFRKVCIYGEIFRQGRKFFQCATSLNLKMFVIYTLIIYKGCHEFYAFKRICLEKIMWIVFKRNACGLLGDNDSWNHFQEVPDESFWYELSKRAWLNKHGCTGDKDKRLPACGWFQCDSAEPGDAWFHRFYCNQSTGEMIYPSSDHQL